MKVIACINLILALITGCISCTPPESLKNTLAGTEWESRYYHYANKYHFLTDSTGYSEDGQLAWSCPIDTLALGIPGDTVLYFGEDAFIYSLTDTVLTVLYYDTTKRPESPRVFYRRKKDNAFVSEYEYTYGREVLFPKGKKSY